VRIILDWLVGEGLNDARYRKYFTDTEFEDLELFMPAVVEQSDEVKKTISTIDTLRRDERYDLHNIAGRGYSEDTIDHCLRRFWGTISTSQDKDDDLYSMYIDISSAIETLSSSEKKVVQLLSDGWSFRDLQLPAPHSGAEEDVHVGQETHRGVSLQTGDGRGSGTGCLRSFTRTCGRV